MQLSKQQYRGSTSAHRVSSRGVAPNRLVPAAAAAPTTASDAKPLWSGKAVAPPKTGKHFLHLDDFSADQLKDMLAQGMMAKKKLYARDETFKPFAGEINL